MNLAKIKEILEKEVCKLLYEKSGITKDELINEDFHNEYTKEDVNKPTKLFYSVSLISPFSSAISGSNIYDLNFDVNIHLETKEHKTIADLLLFLSDDSEIVNRFSDENKKMKINIKNVSLLDNKYFTHKNETFKKEVMTFNMIYEEEK